MTGSFRYASGLAGMAIAACLSVALPARARTQPLQVSANGHYLQTGDGKPFFWLADTAWLLLERLDRAETEQYLRKRASQGYNVVQIMVLHGPSATRRAGPPALIGGDLTRPLRTPGRDPAIRGEYDYWDHLDWVVEIAERHGLYVALVPAWGSFASAGKLTPRAAAIYARFLGRRYRDHANIVWLNGGDTPVDQHHAAWAALGKALKITDPHHLVTFHPLGRMDSSRAFHQAAWLDFNMYQSGHKDYAQDAGPGAYGEDNWRYAAKDWQREPAKPTVDGEPSYENIPHGLHDLGQPRWVAADIRRYAYWSVFGGAMGHSYGDNDVMQFYVSGRYQPAFGADTSWQLALDAPGAGQMRHLKELMLSLPYFDRVPDQSLVIDNGARYEHVVATRGPGFGLFYSYTSAPFTVRLDALGPAHFGASWFDPRTGTMREAGRAESNAVQRFDPPGDTRPGNDWVLVLKQLS